MGFSPCQEHVWVRGDPLPKSLRSIWQDKLQGCCDHHHLVVPDMGLRVCLGFIPPDGTAAEKGMEYRGTGGGAGS